MAAGRHARAWARSSGRPLPTDDRGRAERRAPDGGRARVWREHSLEGAPGVEYVEEWALLDDGGGRVCAARRGDGELLVVVGDFFGYARDFRPRAGGGSARPTRSSSRRSRARSARRAVAARRRRALGARRRLCHGRVSTGWVVELDACGARERRRLVVGGLDGWEPVGAGGTLAFPRDPRPPRRAARAAARRARRRARARAHVAGRRARDACARRARLAQRRRRRRRRRRALGGMTAPPVRFVPAEFEPPAGLRTERLALRALAASDVDADLDAVRDGFAPDGTSPLQRVFARRDAWPWAGITRADDLEDLRRHEAEFSRNLAFAYTVLDADDEARVVGCCYINPGCRLAPRGTPFAAEVYLWVRPSLPRSYDAELERALRAWTASDAWPFGGAGAVVFPGRDGPPGDASAKWTGGKRGRGAARAPRASRATRTVVLHDQRNGGPRSRRRSAAVYCASLPPASPGARSAGAPAPGRS